MGSGRIGDERGGVALLGLRDWETEPFWRQEQKLRSRYSLE